MVYEKHSLVSLTTKYHYPAHVLIHGLQQPQDQQPRPEVIDHKLQRKPVFSNFLMHTQWLISSIENKRADTRTLRVR
jgi:hypothetical protein